MSDPFLIQGPALVSFSGGRTSAYMLWRILQAHGGVLPDDVVVAFANTGKEREETLRFVHDCSSRWGVYVHWLERREGDAKFERVSFDAAARQGEPFAELIARRGFLPNAVTRFCTQELKVRVMKHFAVSIGFTHWRNVVGLRYDEGKRVHRMQASNALGKERWTSVCPLYDARIARGDVDEFWSEQAFDLQLLPYEGNCDLCFLKGRGKLKALIRERPLSADWWLAREASITVGGEGRPVTGARFVTEYSYAALAREVAEQPMLPGIDIDDEFDAECGLICGAAA